MPLSFTGFGGTGILVLVGIAVLFQVGRYLRQSHHHH
jgi:hypothetical protein